MEAMDTSDQSQLEDVKSRNGRGSQSNRMETAGEGEYHTNERKPAATQQCPRKEDGNWHDLWRSGHPDGYGQDMY